MKRRKESKIAVPTEAEVAEYGGAATQGEVAAPGGRTAPADANAVAPSPSDVPPTAEDLRAEAEAWKDKFLRAKAELANYQRRVERDRGDTLRYAHADLVKALLPIVDDLERVVRSADEHTISAEAVLEGVKLTLDGFQKVLRDFQVSVIEAEGQPFNPEEHEAMMVQPSADHAPETVLKEVARGYRLAERVLRPVRVIVSGPVEGVGAGDSGDGEQQKGSTPAEGGEHV